MSMSTSTATRLLITISTETKPSRSSRKGDRLIKQDRENGSIVRRTAKEFPIGTRERQKNSTGQVATTRSSQGRSFADGRTRGDKTLTEAESETAAGLETEVGLAIAAERAVKEELAIAEVPVAPAIVEGRVIEVARVKSPAVAGPVEAAAEAGPAPLKASIAVVARRVAPASAEAPAGEALAAAGQGVGAAAREVEAAEDDEDRLFPWPAVRFRGWKNGTLERWNVEGWIK
jgi:hypothetical protein